MKIDAEMDREAYRHAMDWLTAAVHELPAGVLDGADAATPEACAEMLVELEEFRNVCLRLGLDDHRVFIEQCRWHFEHYPHYLGRQRHFATYATYVEDRRGPLRVVLPPTAEGRSTDA